MIDCLTARIPGGYCLLFAFLASSFKAFLTDPASSSTSTPAFQHPVLSPMALFTALSVSTASLQLRPKQELGHATPREPTWCPCACRCWEGGGGGGGRAKMRAVNMLNVLVHSDSRTTQATCEQYDRMSGLLTSVILHRSGKQRPILSTVTDILTNAMVRDWFLH